MLEKIKTAALGFLAGAAITAISAYQIMEWRLDSKMLEFKTTQEKLQNERDVNAAEVARLGAENARLIDEAAEKTTERVISYVPSDCRPTNQFLCIHDGAVQASSSTCEPDGTPSETKTDRDVLFRVTSNYRICQLELNRLQSLQAWVEAQTK